MPNTNGPPDDVSARLERYFEMVEEYARAAYSTTHRALMVLTNEAA